MRLFSILALFAIASARRDREERLADKAEKDTIRDDILAAKSPDTIKDDVLRSLNIAEMEGWDDNEMESSFSDIIIWKPRCRHWCNQYKRELTRYAYCKFDPEEPDLGPYGIAKFRQTQVNTYWVSKWDPTKPCPLKCPTSTYLFDMDVAADVTDLPPGPGRHGFHVLTYGYEDKCIDARPHWNPYEDNHGAWNAAVRMEGDLQQLTSNAFGGATLYYSEPRADLWTTENIYGRTIEITAKPDDLGLGGNAQSLIDGNSGDPIACCTVMRYKFWPDTDFEPKGSDITDPTVDRN